MAQMKWLTGVVAILVAGIVGLTQAQDGGYGPGDAGDRAAMARQAALEGIRQQIGAEGMEWRLIMPKVEAVLIAQNDVRSLVTLAANTDSQQPISAVQKAARDLMAAALNSQTPTQQLAYKLGVYRDARTAASKQLETARQELREMVSVRQEVVLMSLGLLD
jgi:hypothetical protein